MAASGMSFLTSVIDQSMNVEESFIESVGPVGFSIDQVRKEAQTMIGDPKVVVELAIIGALRGNRPRDADKMILSNGKSLEHIIMTNGFYTGGGTPGRELSLVRISQAFAEAVVLTLQRAYLAGKLKKRFPLNKLPPCLEFMGAGSLTMPPEIRDEHRIFAIEFSDVLGRAKDGPGRYAKFLYDTMEANATDPSKFQFKNVRLESVRRDVANWEETALKLGVQVL